MQRGRQLLTITSWKDWVRMIMLKKRRLVERGRLLSTIGMIKAWKGKDLSWCSRQRNKVMGTSHRRWPQARVTAAKMEEVAVVIRSRQRPDNNLRCLTFWTEQYHPLIYSLYSNSDMDPLRSFVTFLFPPVLGPSPRLCIAFNCNISLVSFNYLPLFFMTLTLFKQYKPVNVI